MEANIKMQVGFYSQTEMICGNEKLIIVANLPFVNEVINYPYENLNDKDEFDIGVWKIKQLKQ
jgi:hypothetical protein